MLYNLYLITSLVVISKAQAGSYVFDWYDGGVEWYFPSADSTGPIGGKADTWTGHFTLQDSAVTYCFDGIYEYAQLDLSKYLDFSLTGKLISGNYMEATAFHGDSVYAPVWHDSISFYGALTGTISFVMANPSWMNTPFSVSII